MLGPVLAIVGVRLDVDGGDDVVARGAQIGILGKIIVRWKPIEGRIGPEMMVRIHDRQIGLERDLVGSRVLAIGFHDVPVLPMISYIASAARHNRRLTERVAQNLNGGRFGCHQCIALFNTTITQEHK